MVLPALRHGGYSCHTQVRVGTRPGGRRHKADVVAEKDGRSLLVSLKWQQVPGTAEQKVPFEVISLVEILESGAHAGAYLVLGGAGWTLRDYFTGGGLRKHLVHADKVQILTLEQFIAMANQGRL